MVSLELLAGKTSWNAGDDLLDLKGFFQLAVNGEQLPPKFFPDGLEIQVYETSFELIDLLGNIIDQFKGDTPGKASSTFQAEFCYTGNYMDASVKGPDEIEVSILFNPAVVDDEELLEGKRFTERTSLFNLATEILVFSISAVNAILDFNSGLEQALEELQIAILNHTDILEKEFNLQIFPPEEGDKK